MRTVTDAAIGVAIEERLARPEGQEGCWLWTGRYADGAPDLQLGNRHVRVRRWLYRQAGGALTPTQVTVPRCTRQACVNPAHTVATKRRDRALCGEGLRYWGPRAPRTEGR